MSKPPGVSAIPAEKLIHPCTEKTIRENASIESMLFASIHGGIPHTGVHLSGPKVHAMASGELIATRLDGNYPFMLLRHTLALPAFAPLTFYTLLAQFKSHSQLKPAERKKIRILPDLKFPAFLKEDPQKQWTASHGLPLLDAGSGLPLAVIPRFSIATDLGSTVPPPGYKGKGWHRLAWEKYAGVACLGKKQYRQARKGFICILSTSHPVPTEQIPVPAIPLYSRPQESERFLAESHPPFTLAEATLVDSDWMQLHSLAEKKLPTPLFVRRNHLALGADPHPAGDDVWYGSRPVPARWLLGYGSDIHIELFLEKPLDSLPVPLLARILPSHAWNEFSTVDACHALQGANEWAGFTPTLQKCADPVIRQEIQKGAEEACWWTPHLEQTLKLPPHDQLFHIHPLVFAAHWNRLRNTLPRHSDGSPLGPEDWKSLGALASMLHAEMTRLRIKSGDPALLPLFRALAARLHAQPLDWRHCVQASDLLQDLCGSAASTLAPEEWMAEGFLSDSELREIILSYTRNNEDKASALRLYHASSACLSQQGWNLQGLQCDRNGIPKYQILGNLVFYTPRPEFQGYLTRPAPLLQADKTMARTNSQATVTLVGWEPDPQDPHAEDHLHWQVWVGNNLISSQTGGNACPVHMPARTDIPLVTILALYQHSGHTSHGQCSILVENSQVQIVSTPAKGQTLKLADPANLQESLAQLGYWSLNEKDCQGALTTLQFEYGLPVTGVLDPITQETLERLHRAGAPLQELRGRPGIAVRIPQKDNSVLSTRFYQLPCPLNANYGAYGEMCETRHNGSALDTTPHNEKWGQGPMVIALEKLLCAWYQDTADRIRVNDLSYYQGGASTSHKSHRDGLDVDLRSEKVGAREICGQKNSLYSYKQTADWIDRALSLGFGTFCTFDTDLAQAFAGDKRGRVLVVAGHHHHLHMHYCA